MTHRFSITPSPAGADAYEAQIRALVRKLGVVDFMYRLEFVVGELDDENQTDDLDQINPYADFWLAIVEAHNACQAAEDAAYDDHEE